MRADGAKFFKIPASTRVREDFNGDGKLDLVTNNRDSDGGIGILQGNGDGTFSVSYLFGQLINTLAVGDFNQDGKLDIVVGGAETDVLLGAGNGTFGAVQKVGPAGADLVVADFNGDGSPDLAEIALSSGSIDVILNNADWRPKGHK